MNISEYIFDFFAQKGVDTAFIITGGQAMYLDDALGKDKRYEVICNHHEQAATMAADAYGRLKNKPAIALVTAGPGAVNAINGVVGGFTDSSPMIVISGHTNLNFVEYQEKHNIRQYGIQGINIEPLVKDVVKYFVTIKDKNEVLYHLEKAYYYATSGRPGPVWIEVPLDIQATEVAQYQKHFTPDCNTNNTFIEDTTNKIIEKLKYSKRPAFLVGQGVSLSKSRELFIELLKKIRIPVITARLGIDLIESDNELYVGRPGNYGERSANFAIQNADLLIVLGCRLASSLVGHNPSIFARNAYTIVVDIDKEELKKPGPHIDYTIEADCKELIQSLSKINEKLPDYSNWINQCNIWKKQYPVVLDEYKNERPVNSYYFVERLSNIASNNVTVLVDTGSCFHVACQSWKIKKGQKFLTTGGISSMGYWVAGIGACMAQKKETIVITGDGSLQMNIQEFATIKQNNLPIKVFVFNNNGYLLIRHTQRNFMNDRFFGESPNTGVWCPDCSKIANAYEIGYEFIDSPDRIEEKIKKVLNTNGPVLCEVKTPEWQLLIPRISSEKMPDGKLVAHDYEDMFPFLSREELEKNMIYKKK